MVQSPTSMRMMNPGCRSAAGGKKKPRFKRRRVNCAGRLGSWNKWRQIHDGSVAKRKSIKQQSSPHIFVLTSHDNDSHHSHTTHSDDLPPAASLLLHLAVLDLSFDRQLLHYLSVLVATSHRPCSSLTTALTRCRLVSSFADLQPLPSLQKNTLLRSVVVGNS